MPTPRGSQPDDSGEDAAARTERRTQERGAELLDAVRRRARAASPSQRLNDAVMALATGDPRTKVELLRFVDALPALHGAPEAVAQHLREYLLRPDVALPPGASTLLHALEATGPTRRLLAGAATVGTRLMARRFIAGRDADEAERAVRRLRRHGLAFTLDLLGEAVTSEADARAYQQAYLDLLARLCDRAASWPGDPRLDAAPWGPLPRVNVSIKLSSLFSRFDPMAADATSEAVKDRLRPVLALARGRGAFVNVDREQHDFADLTRRIFEEILCEDAFRDWSDVGIVVQAYLRDAEDEMLRLRDWARSRGTPVWVRLVKGAYWDSETILSAQRGHPSPVWARKAETDANYERLTRLLLGNADVLRPAVASHNVRSLAHAQALAETLDLPPGAVEYQVLYGMGDAAGRALAERGERVRVYVPFGELLPGMAYLVRRLLENTSNDSFVRHVADEDGATLLAPPTTEPPVADPPTPPLAFCNEPETDFAVAANRDAMRAALDAVRGRLGETVPVVIDGRREVAEKLTERPDPSDVSRVVARVSCATTEQAERALAVASEAFPAWRDTPASERAALLRRVADEFIRRRFEIAAWQVFEVGKPWREADADVAEAVDFCRFYVAEMERLSRPRRRDVPGEWNEMVYEGRGPAVIIAPWNFPLAILTGMTAAALVCGNPVVLKPAEQSSRVGLFLMEALEAAGVPRGVAHFLPGEGETIGPLLVSDARVATVAFTGSKAVGLEILREAAVVRPGQREIKHVIAELGGKNAILVDEDADLDEAVVGVLASATGFAGQKCSACARVVAVGSAYEPLCARLAAAVESLRIGPAEDPSTTLGPVVDAAARDRVLDYLDVGHREGRLLARANPPAELATRGFYVPAAVFTDCPLDSRLCREEIFGPVVALLRARNLDEALALADDSDYALTGGFYSRSPANIERVRREFRVGNLYVNRRITGALVDRQPFGGARMSGAGAKAGGPDYLLHFLHARTITESVMRRGFAPDGVPKR